MANRPCPQCGHQAPRYLPASSAGATVLYYMCDACGCVFHLNKIQPADTPTIVRDGQTTKV